MTVIRPTKVGTLLNASRDDGAEMDPEGKQLMWNVADDSGESERNVFGASSIISSAREGTQTSCGVPTEA